VNIQAQVLGWFCLFKEGQMTIEVGVSYSSCFAIVTEEFSSEVGLNQVHFMTADTGGEKKHLSVSPDCCNMQKVKIF
jgi:hypothetical protein